MFSTFKHQKSIVLFTVSLGFLVLFLFAAHPAHAADVLPPAKETVVIAQPADPYYSLAQEIAWTESLPLVADLSAAAGLNPRYILWVAAPENITSDLLLKTGQYFAQKNTYPGLGFITGSTLENARSLWQRAAMVRAGRVIIAADAEPPQHRFEPAIYDLNPSAPQQLPLNRDNLLTALSQADFFHWSRHSGPSTWYWNSESGEDFPDSEIHAADLPALPPVVIYAPSCSSFRPWRADSIALAFVDSGAAAYAGFLNSPFHTNAVMKQDLSVPGPTAWADFPLGLVVQAENRVAARAYFSTPQFFMLGDPRVHLLDEPPYQILSDQVQADDWRVIRGESDQAGALPIKIADGAAYDYVSAAGVTAVSEGDLFHNTRLQTLNLGADKYLLLWQTGGPFELRLSAHTPLFWGFADTLVDALDYGWVVMWLDRRVVNAPVIHLIALIVFAALVGMMVVRRKVSLRSVGMISLWALIPVIVRAGYVWLRADDYTISANLVAFPIDQVLLGLACIFACTAGGLLLLRGASTPFRRMAGWAFALLPDLILVLFYLAFIPFMNLMTPVTGMTAAWQWNFNILLLAAIHLLLQAVFFFAIQRAARPSLSL